MRGNTPLRHVSLFTDDDIHLLKEGSHFRLYEKLGSHAMTVDGAAGTFFAVWAPNAQKVSVIGDFNEWGSGSDPLQVREDGSGIWEGFIPGACAGALYKYHITSRYD
ncbi:MAG: 1,4-alpha-glucan branching enzyme, partial [Nitrospiria bacterium]